MEGRIDFKSNQGTSCHAATGGSKGNVEDLEAMTEAALKFFRAAVDPATSKIYSCWLIPAAHV